jgi:hypothetical protein
MHWIVVIFRVEKSKDDREMFCESELPAKVRIHVTVATQTNKESELALHILATQDLEV